MCSAALLRNRNEGANRRFAPSFVTTTRRVEGCPGRPFAARRRLEFVLQLQEPRAVFLAIGQVPQAGPTGHERAVLVENQGRIDRLPVVLRSDQEAASLGCGDFAVRVRLLAKLVGKEKPIERQIRDVPFKSGVVGVPKAKEPDVGRFAQP